MLLEYQYNNEQATAAESFNFLDNWFNNGDGPHVAEPHPARHWIWGGGGATYYAVGNSDGHQDVVRVPDGNFEDGVVPDGSESRPPPAAVGPAPATRPSTGITGYPSILLRTASRDLCPT